MAYHGCYPRKFFEKKEYKKWNISSQQKQMNFWLIIEKLNDKSFLYIFFLTLVIDTPLTVEYAISSLSIANICELIKNR